MTELAEFYGGSKVLSRNVKDDNLKSWFEHIAEEVVGLYKLNPEGIQLQNAWF
jgi:hypothetical protein